MDETRGSRPRVLREGWVWVWGEFVFRCLGLRVPGFASLGLGSLGSRLEGCKALKLRCRVQNSGVLIPEAQG